MTTSMRRLLSGLAAASLVGALAMPAAAADRDRRPAPRSETPRAAPRSAPARPQGSGGASARAPRTSPRQPAAGHATYGHGAHGAYGGYGGYGSYPWWGWYGYPWWSADLYWGWGWPSWGPWAYAPPRYLDERTTAVYADRGPAFYALDVTPRRATVELDGENVGRAKDWDGRWDRLPVDPGVRVLTFASPGYKTLRIRVDAATGGFYRLSYDLAKGEGLDSRSTTSEAKLTVPVEPPEAAPPDDGESRGGLVKGFLRVKLGPGDAAVYLDGSYFARADELARLRGAVPLAAGTHTLEIVRPGYSSRKVDVEIAPGKAVEVEIELEAAP